MLEEKLCANCGHSESRHQTPGGFCKHCECNQFVDPTAQKNTCPIDRMPMVESIALESDQHITFICETCGYAITKEKWDAIWKKYNEAVAQKGRTTKLVRKLLTDLLAAGSKAERIPPHGSEEVG